MRRPTITVKEFKQKLAGMDEMEHVVVALEDDSGSQYFDVVEVSSHLETPVRSPDGPANWTFIEIEKASGEAHHGKEREWP